MLFFTVLESIVRNSHAAVLLLSADGTVLFRSERLCEVWGLPENGSSGPDWWQQAADLLADPPAAWVDLSTRWQGHPQKGRVASEGLAQPGDGHTLPHVVNLALKDGRWLKQTCHPIELEDGSMARLCSWYEVTDDPAQEQSFQQSHDLLNKLSARVPGIIFKFKMWPDGRSCFPYMSDAVSTMYPGVTPEAIKNDATPFFAFRHPADAAGLVTSMMRSAQTMEPWDHEYRLILPHKGVVWRHGNARPEKQDDGSIAWHGFITDITERKRIEQELRLKSLVFDTSSEGILVCDGHDQIVAINPSFTRITGYELADLEGQTPKILRSGRHDETFYAQINASVVQTGEWQGEIWNRRKSGDIYPQWMRIITVAGVGNEPDHRIGIFTDITAQKQTDEHIWRQTNFDTLTGLPNRRLLLERLRQEVRKSAVNGCQIAVLFVDLDHFKEVNDTLGHDPGDQLLIETAQRLSSCIRKSDTLARLGGDEFTVMLVDYNVTKLAEHTADLIETRLAMPYQLGNERVFVSASVGITLYPDHATDVDTLFRNADQAMYAAKRAGRNQHVWYTPVMQSEAMRHRKLAEHLRDALQAGQFEVYYQPILCLKTRRVAKAEALLRWHSPDMPGVGPAEFIPVAEELGLINEIGEWVFRQVTHMVKALNLPSVPPLQVALNMSPRQFTLDDSSLHWGQHLRSAGVDAANIAIEITEGLLLDNRPEVLHKLRQLHEAGLQVALDDFGTGYSAMSYLLKFQIDILKIDQSFVRNVHTEGGRAIVEAVVAMSHKLGMLVVAEGVEHAHELAFLQSIECDFAQGYLFAKPVAPDAFRALIEQDRQGDLLGAWTAG